LTNHFRKICFSLWLGILCITAIAILFDIFIFTNVPDVCVTGYTSCSLNFQPSILAGVQGIIVLIPLLILPINYGYVIQAVYLSHRRTSQYCINRMLVRSVAAVGVLCLTFLIGWIPLIVTAFSYDGITSSIGLEIHICIIISGQFTVVGHSLSQKKHRNAIRSKFLGLVSGRDGCMSVAVVPEVVINVAQPTTSQLKLDKKLPSDGC